MLAFIVSGGLVAVLVASGASHPAPWSVRANAICDRWDHAVHRLGSARTLPDVSRTTALAATLADRFTNQLDQLEPPPHERRTEREFILAIRRTADSLRDLSRAAGTNSRAATDQAATDLKRAVRSADRLAVALTVKQCRSNDG